MSEQMADGLWVQHESKLKQVPIQGQLDVGRWRKVIREAFELSVPAKRLELWANGALLSCGVKLSKVTAAGHGLDPLHALQLTWAARGEKSEVETKEMQMAAMLAEEMVKAGKLKARGYWCDSCSAYCSSAIAWKQHSASSGHSEAFSNPWQRGTMMLKEFPCRSSGTLEVSTKYFDLSERQKELLWQSSAHGASSPSRPMQGWELRLGVRDYRTLRASWPRGSAHTTLERTPTPSPRSSTTRPRPYRPLRGS